jgi:hypothetical protein
MNGELCRKPQPDPLMKPTAIHLTRLLLTCTLGTAGLFAAPAQPKTPPAVPDKPTIATPPAVKQGAVENPAPFPSARQFEDDKGPNDRAISRAPESTPATTPPAPPSNVKARVERDTAPAITTVPPQPDPGSLPTGRATMALAASLDAPTFGPSLRSASVATRTQVIADLESRMTTAENALTTMGNSVSEMSADGRQRFKAASDEVKERSRALRKSVQAARQASEQQWESARAQLASDYDAYAAALGRIDAAATVTPPTP